MELRGVPSRTIGRRRFSPKPRERLRNAHLDWGTTVLAGLAPDRMAQSPADDLAPPPPIRRAWPPLLVAPARRRVRPSTPTPPRAPATATAPPRPPPRPRRPAPPPSAAPRPRPRPARATARSTPAPSAAQGRPARDANDPNAATCTRRSRARSRRSAASRATSPSSGRRSTGRPCAPTSRRASRRTTRAALVDGNRGPVQGARADAPGRRRCATSTSSCSRARSRACTTTTTKKMYVVTEHGRDRAGREDHVRPRVHARAPGPGVHAARHHGRREGPGRPGARPDDARRGRRDAADVALGPAAPHPGRAARRSPGATDPASQAVLDRHARDPASETLLFPYTQGLKLTLGAFTAGGGYAGVDAAVRQPARLDRAGPPPREARRARGAGRRWRSPTTSRQRLGDGWWSPLQDTLGEFQLRIMLGDAAGVDSATAEAAAAGWGGDRVALIDGPDGATRRGPRHRAGTRTPTRPSSRRRSRASSPKLQAARPQRRRS